MPHKEPIDILERMPGKTFFFEQIEETIANYEFEGPRCLIHTNKQTHNFLWADGRQYLKRFLPIPAQDIAPVGPQLGANYTPVLSTDLMHTIKDTILANIEGVKKDRAFVPQANAINNSVRSLIELVKAEVTLARTLRNQ
jgi:hypothetical protein